MGLAPLLVLCFLLGTAAPRRAAAACSSTLLGDHHLRRWNTSGLHLTLHHIHGPCSPLTLPEQSTDEMLGHDVRRVEALAARLSPASGKEESAATPKPGLGGVQFEPASVKMPLTSGLPLGVGNYVAKIGLGTPAKSYLMVVDTGSSLTWLQCKPCRVSCHAQFGAVFDPAASSSYRALSCSSAECGSLKSATLNAAACSSSGVCIYEASYGDNSFSLGYLSKDTLSLGGAAAVPGFVYGCGNDNEGLFGKTAGLVGLARNKLSMLSQLAPKYGNAFAYCLPSTKSSGYLSIGFPGAGKFTYTPMVASSLDSTLYFLNFAGMVVGQKALAVSAAAYRGMPTIIDSGTVITRLPPPVYSALSLAVTAALARYPKAAAYSILDTCYKGSYESLPVPEVRMIFAGGAELRLSPHNVFYDVTNSTTCLAFARASSVAIIGNRQQQTFTVLYDVAGSRIGFSSGGCG